MQTTSTMVFDEQVKSNARTMTIVHCDDNKMDASAKCMQRKMRLTTLDVPLVCS